MKEVQRVIERLKRIYHEWPDAKIDRIVPVFEKL